MPSHLVTYFLVLLTALQASTIKNEATSEDVYRIIEDEMNEMLKDIEYGTWTKKRTCKNSCERIQHKKDTGECYCNSKCENLGECCLEYWKSCNASFKQVYGRPTLFSCVVPIFLFSNDTKMKDPKEMGYEVVTRCPQNYPDRSIKESCEISADENNDVLPFVSDEDGRAYKNEFCAICNNIPHFQQWRTALKCFDANFTNFVEVKLNESIIQFTRKERQKVRDSCVLQMAPPEDVKNKLCVPAIECDNKTHEDFWKCKLYKLPVYYQLDYIVYKNPHCARCSGIDLFDHSAISVFTHTQSSLGVLFDFSKASRIYSLKDPIEVTEERQCKENEIYDFQLKSCRTKQLSYKAIISNWTCSYMNETLPNTSDYITINENQTIYVKSHSKLYRRGEYFWHEGNVTVCGNLTTTYQAKIIKRLDRLYSMAEYVITIVGLTLSILALIAVLVTYLIFPELRCPLPGKIVINLSIALIFAQIVFLFDMFFPITGGGCMALAILLHFLYLSAFSWMNVMAFDVSRTFVGKSQRSRSGSRKKIFLFCSLYAWGGPCIVTGVTLLIDQTGAMEVAYGNNYYCWITNPVALMIFFAVPVVLMLLFNIVALARVLVAVRKVRKVTKKVRDTSTAAEDVRMCWKLTAVFGLTWILCLAAEYHVSLRIIFVILNSLQGVFIMIGFILTRRVLRMYKKKAGRESFSINTPNSTRRYTLSRVENGRKTSSIPKGARKSLQKRRDTKEHEEEAEDKTLLQNTSATPLIDSTMKEKHREPSEEIHQEVDLATAKLIQTIEGPETDL